MSFNQKQFRTLISETLKNLKLHSPSAVNLLLGTAAQESYFGTYLRQIDGPAQGVYQMEARTERDIWINFLKYRPELKDRVCNSSGMTGRPLTNLPHSLALRGNLLYQTVMCRIHYLRVPEAFPMPDDVYGLAHYWKKHYNTSQGNGTVAGFIDNYKHFCE